MHPAPSIIIFTVLSGFGFGALFYLGLGLVPASGFGALVPFGLALGAAGLGLVASAFHLGHPERALKAFTQWRSSWLSREGWLSMLTLALAAAFGGAIVFLDQPIEKLGQTLSAGAVLTVFATSMIYAQLKTVPRWNDWTTPILFLAAAATGGAFLVPGTPVIAALIGFGVLQAAIWYRGTDRFEKRGHTTGTATGLGARGQTRSFEPPHTGTNYLLNEMVYVVGRRNAMQLKVISLILATLIPAVLLALSDGFAIRMLALGSHLLGMVASRWLFFAEAEHVVGLYYGKR